MLVGGGNKQKTKVTPADALAHDRSMVLTLCQMAGVRRVRAVVAAADPSHPVGFEPIGGVRGVIGLYRHPSRSGRPS
jgi:hypothetical protein